MTDNVGARDLPKEVSRGKIMIGAVEIEVVHLDDGRRIVTDDSMERFLAAIAQPATPND